MGKGTPVSRTSAVAGAELLSAGAWAMIDAQSLADNALWITIAGALLLIAAYFWDEVKEYRAWKRGGHIAKRHLAPLHRALQYVARDSVWAAEYDAPDTNWVVGLRAVFQRELSHGTITAFGYKEVHTWALEPGVTQLKPNFWRQASLDISHLAGFHPPKRAHVNSDHFDFIEVDMDEVRSAFPPRSKADAKAKKSPVERIGSYDELWAEQERKYSEALKDRHLSPVERVYKDD